MGLSVFLSACPADHSQEHGESAVAPSPSAGTSAKRVVESPPTDIIQDALPVLPHYASPAPMSEVLNESPWRRRSPAQAAGPLTSLSPWGQETLVATSQGELWRVSQPGQWSAMGQRHALPWVDVASAVDGDRRAAVLLDSVGALWLGEGADGGWRQVGERAGGFQGSGREPWWRQEAPYHAVAARWVGDRLVLLACGRGMHVRWSMDGGQRWSDEALGGTQDLADCAVGVDGTLAVVGQRGEAYRKDPDQAQWSKILMGGKPQMQAVAFDDEVSDRLLVVGLGGAVRVSDNRGVAWIRHDVEAMDFVSVSLPEGVDGDWWAALDDGRVVRARPGATPRSWEVAWGGDGRPLSDIVWTASGVPVALGPEWLVRGDAGLKSWSPLRSLPTLRAVWSSPKGLAVAVGERGLVMRAESGRWAQIKDNVGGERASWGLAGQDLTAVSSSRGRFVWAATHTGQVAVSLDGARRWKLVDPDPRDASPLKDLAALDARNVFAVGASAQLYHSADQGLTWRSAPLPSPGSGAATPLGASRIVLQNSAQGASAWVGGERGAMWSGRVGAMTGARVDGLQGALDLAAPRSAAPQGDARVESSSGRQWWLDVSGMLLRRESPEQGWRVLSMASEVSLSAGAMADGGQGVIISAAGQLMRTEDSGKRWMLSNTGTARVLNDVVWAGEDVFIAVGHGGLVLRSEDGGRHWSIQPTQSGRTLTAVARLEDRLVAVGYRGVMLESLDRGVSWRPWEGGPGAVGAGHLTAIEVAQDGSVVLGGVGVLMVRRPEALSWESVPGAEGIKEVRRLVLGPEGRLFVVSATGRLWGRLESDGAVVLLSWPGPDGERAWWQDMLVRRWSPLDAQVALERGVYRLQASSKVEASASDVLQWTHASARPGGVKAGRWLRQGRRAWLLAPGGLWATDGVGRWSQVISGWPLVPDALSFADAEHGLAVGRGGLILVTSDGGESWRRERSGVMGDLRGVWSNREGHGWAVGEGGLILERVPVELLTP